MEKSRIFDSWKMIVLGSVITLSTCLFTYVRQYFDWQINGTAFDNPLNYLKEFPLAFFLAIGIILICVGVAIRIIEKE